MRWKARVPQPPADYSEWHVFYPIFPRKVGDHWICFEKVLRKGTLHKWIEYRPFTDGGTGLSFDDEIPRQKWTWEYKYYGDLMS